MSTNSLTPKITKHLVVLGILMLTSNLWSCGLMPFEKDDKESNRQRDSALSVSLAKQIGVAIVKYGSRHGYHVIYVNGESINKERGNAGGCSGTYFPSLDRAQERLAEYKAMHDYLSEILNKSACPFKWGDFVILVTSKYHGRIHPGNLLPRQNRVPPD